MISAICVSIGITQSASAGCRMKSLLVKVYKFYHLFSLKMYYQDGVSGQMEVIGFSLNECLSSLSCIRLMIPQKLTGMDEKRKCYDQLKEIKRRYPDGLPLMDPIEDMHITGKNVT